ncbi:MAG: carboxypeptidase regulatory-like domain-containing protein [Bryobacteraceae bacterium]
MTRKRVSPFLFAFVFSAYLSAQSHRTVIVGQVTDASGAAVAGADVKVIQKATNVARETKSNASGNYEVPGLLPGAYRVEASHPGFKTAAVDDLELTSGRRVEVNLSMSVGEVREAVTVTAEKQILDTASADVNTVIDQKKVLDLPLGQGHATYLFLMAPGADSASSEGRGGSGMDIQPLQRQGTSQTRFNGSPQGTTEYTLDGTPNTQRGNSLAGGGSSFNPSAEMVQEVRIQTSTYDASVGHTGGATVDLVLRSGTNVYHGSGLGFVRNPDWNANSWAGNRGGVKRPDFTYRRWGFTGGGPVRLGPVYNGKDKTFFYYGYERWSSLSPNPPSTETIPTPAQIGGDLSGLLKVGVQYQLYDPDTARAAANNRIERLPLANNIIPASRIDPMAKAFARLWPAPNNPGTADGQLNFSYNPAPEPRRYWSSVLRMDHNLSRSHKLFGRLILSQTTIPYSNLFGRTDISNLSQIGKNRDVAVSDVWTVSPTLVADFRASISRFLWDSTPIGRELNYKDLGLESVSRLIDSSRAGMPSVTVTGYTAFSNSAGSRNISDIRNGAAHFTKILGRHGFKFGADARWYILNRGGEDIMRASFSGAYSRGPLDNSPAPPIGSGLADFLFGRFASATISQPSKAANLSTYQGIYFQDDWKIAPRLTLNLGVRYEREGPPTERFDRALGGFAYDVENPLGAAIRANYARSPIPEVPVLNTKGGILYAGVGGVSREMYQARNRNFAPRIGFAYQATNNTVVRGGYGLYYIPYGQRFFANEGGVPGFDVTTQSYSTQDNGLTFVRRTSNIFPDGLDLPTGSANGLKTYVAQGLSFGPFGSLGSAYNQRWQFSVQQRFAGMYKLEARYVGNRTVKMPMTRNIDPVPAQYLSRSPERDQKTIDYLSELVQNPLFGISGLAGLATSRTVGRSQLLRPYPIFNGVTVTNNQGWSTYHALQVEFERSFTSGFSFQTSYTFSKMMDGMGYLNETDAVPEKVISAADRPHSWRFMAVYELPFGRGLRGLPGILARGWQVQGITFIESSAPIGWGNIIFRGDIKNLVIAQQVPERMFNIDAGFERDSRRQLASNIRTFPSRLSAVRGSTATSTDFSVIKNTRLTERLTFQLRGEAYNAWNQHFFREAYVNTTPANTAFGTTQTASSPRAMQLGLRLQF